MNSKIYEMFRPEVDWRSFWLEITLLTASLLIPISTLVIWKDGIVFARSGSLMVFLAVTTEFVSLNKASKKHILNACRAKANEYPWDFSKSDRVIGIASLICGLLGTIIWGYGDLLI